MEDLGYGAKVRILGAAYYGVPQSRWRTIILALRGKELPSYAYPIPTNNAPIKPNFRVHYAGQSLLELPPQEATACFTTVEQAIGDLPKIEAGEKYQAVGQYPAVGQYSVGGQYPGAALSEYQIAMRKGSNGIWNHEAAGISNINKERFSFIKPGGNWTDIPIELLPKGMQRAKRSDHTKRYGRVKPGDLASTILTKCDPHWGAFIHYSQDRAFSVREAARIQSFPDTYIFTGTLSEQYAQVGNAVPPLLAKAVGRSLMNVLAREFVD